MADWNAEKNRDAGGFSEQPETHGLKKRGIQAQAILEHIGKDRDN